MIQREIYLAKIRPFMNQQLVKVITGIRRCGKSILLKQVEQELISQGVASSNVLSFNFEDLRLAHLLDASTLYTHIMQLIEKLSGRVYLFFDEIQEVTDWERCINSLLSTQNVDLYLSGSNARLLSGELVTLLSGRYIEIKLYPLSFKEFVTLYHEKFPAAETDVIFRVFRNLGGMPFLHNLSFEQDACQQYLRDLYTTVMIKDVIKRNNFRDVDLLERVILYVAAHIGQPFSANSLAKYMKSEKRKTSPETIMNILKACEEAFLFCRLERFDLIGKSILQVNEKYYLMDHGLREAVYGNNQRDIQLVLENMVCLELLHRGYKVQVGRVGGAEEVDFVCENSKGRIYIQVTYLLATPETVEREFSSLIRIQDNYPKYVLSLDEVDFSQNGIIHQNIKDFLLAN